MAAITRKLKDAQDAKIEVATRCKSALITPDEINGGTPASPSFDIAP